MMKKKVRGPGFLNIKETMDRETTAEEFGLSYVRVNHLIRQYDGDIEQIALSREKRKSRSTKKAPKTERVLKKIRTKITYSK